MDVIKMLEWRYATKKMDPSKVVAQDKVDRIIEAARLAPTSSGLQPFEIVVVTNPEVRAQIQTIAWNQAQITEGSHLLVFAAWDNYTTERINHMFDYTNEVRGFRNEGWENYRNMLLNMYPQRDAETNYQHAARQAYIGFGAAMIAAAAEGVDSTPMEGFDPDKLDAILGLRARGLRSVTLLPLGYRQEEGDWLAKLQKVRRPLDQFVTEVK
ncbi:nitroreductase family protein [Roseateles koreensis]|uniref:Nitroreductase family protein n=1 Tax=Roseateles koreensis TaxID=2987526 RepID=A0ABT5KVI5_9BURK|nr:nitroreductase family protein [Roseateles koreensis]MDC8786460.1 nitroreductase family protein [Roseateles koreensis]